MLQDANKKTDGGSDDLLSKINASFGNIIDKITGEFKKNMNVDEIVKAVEEVDNASLSISKQFGQARENILGLKAAMTAAYTDIVALGGSFADISKIQSEVSGGLNRNLVLTKEAYKDLYAVSSVTGKDAQTIALSFKDAGYSVYQSGDEMAKVVNTARQLGVSVESVSKGVLDNMDAINKFSFDGGVQGLAKMAAQASLLRIDMNKSLSLAESLWSPDKAIDLAASMQRLGVANSALLDPLRLMDMSMNDPEELQNQIVKMTQQFVQFNKETGKFEIPAGARMQLKEIGEKLGYNYSEMTKMALGAKELDMKMQQIRFPENAFSEEQKQFIANMTEMGKDGKFQISIDGEPTEISAALEKFREKPELLEAMKKAGEPKKMEDLAYEQLTELKKLEANTKTLVKTPMAIAGTKVAEDALKAPAQLSKVLADSFNTEALGISKIRKSFGETSESILKSINSIIKGEGSMTQLADILTKTGKDFENFVPVAAKQTMENYNTSMQKLADEHNIFTDILIAAGKKLKEKFIESENLGTVEGNKGANVEDFYIKTLPEDKLVIAGGTNLVPNNGQMTNDQMGKLKEMIQNITNNTQGQQMNANTKVDFTMTIDAKNLPPTMNKDEIINALRDTGIQQKIGEITRTIFTNNNLTTDEPNRVKQIFKQR